jgi:hypothetical protein
VLNLFIILYIISCANFLIVKLCDFFFFFINAFQLERNDRSFEDRERTLEEIRSLFFYTLYLLTSTFVYSLVISYHDFLVIFSPSS